MGEQNSLVIFTKASQMLAEAVTVQKAKELKDLALTAADWAKRKGMGQQAIAYAQSYALQAERRMGEMLKTTERNKGAKGIGRSAVMSSDRTPTLKDIGITKNESARAQKVADINEDIFSEIISGEKPITKALGELKLAERRTDIKRQKSDIASGKTKLPEGKYEIIVIDPPWRYSEKEDAGYDSNSFRGTTPYPTMSIDEIKKLKLPASNDCIVWLWTTQKHLKYAFGILESWGFEDKAILTWCKNKMGIGKWLRSKSEFCIMAVKGKPKINLTNQTTVLNADAREHSRKPDEFYSMVDELCIGRKLDYFSRESRKGWDSHGVEASKF